MKLRLPLALLLGLVILLPAASAAPLRVDRTRSFIDVDVKATLVSFTGRLERYQAAVELDAAGRIRAARLQFRFADLRTGNAERDAHLLAWLGGGDPAGEYELGVLALAPDGQGQSSGKLTLNGRAQRVEFPVLVTRAEGAITIEGTAVVDARRWGLKPLRHRVVVKVDPEVKIRFRLTVRLPSPEE